MCNHQLYPAWVNFSIVERFLVWMFGPWYGVVLVFGVIMDAITAVSIYGIARRCLDDSCRTPILAALLYAFNPSSFVYAATATPEHVCVACFAFATYMTIRMFQDACGLRHCVALGLCIGLVAGLGNAVKSFFVLFAVALFFALSLSISAFRGRWKALLIGFAVMMIVELMVSAGFTCMRKRIFSQEPINPIPHFLCVGLNRQGEGQIHLGNLSRRWAQMVAKGRPEQEAADITKREVLADWQGNWGSVGKFFVQKMVWAWQDDNTPFRYLEGQIWQRVIQKSARGEAVRNGSIFAEMKKPSSLVCGLWRSVQTAALLWYLAFMACCAMGMVRIASTGELDVSKLFVVLLILGFCGVIALCEAQSRYKCFILPYFCVVGGTGAMLFSKKKSF